MPPPSRRPSPNAARRVPRGASGRASGGAIRAASLAAALGALCLAAATPAAAFKVAESTDFKGCAIWTNDAGEPLRNRQGREIGRKTPCGQGTHNRDVYEVLFGEAPGTLVIRDATHGFECILELAQGSTTVVVPKLCQRWAGG